MSEQDNIDRQGQGIFQYTFSKGYFMIEPLGGNESKYPDIDGLIQLCDSNGARLNQYLFYQLKSKKRVKNGKYFCRKKPFIEYSKKTNVPTVLVVVDITE